MSRMPVHAPHSPQPATSVRRCCGRRPARPLRCTCCATRHAASRWHWPVGMKTARRRRPTSARWQPPPPCCCCAARSREKLSRSMSIWLACCLAPVHWRCRSAPSNWAGWTGCWASAAPQWPGMARHWASSQRRRRCRPWRRPRLPWVPRAPGWAHRPGPCPWLPCWPWPPDAMPLRRARPQSCHPRCPPRCQTRQRVPARCGRPPAASRPARPASRCRKRLPRCSRRGRTRRPTSPHAGWSRWPWMPRPWGRVRSGPPAWLRSRAAGLSRRCVPATHCARYGMPTRRAGAWTWRAIHVRRAATTSRAAPWVGRRWTTCSPATTCRPRQARRRPRPSSCCSNPRRRWATPVVPMALDAGQLLWLAEVFASGNPDAALLDEAVACVHAALRRLDQNERLEEAHFGSSLGRQMWQAEPGRFSRVRMSAYGAALAQAHADALARQPVKRQPPAATGEPVDAMRRALQGAEAIKHARRAAAAGHAARCRAGPGAAPAAPGLRQGLQRRGSPDGVGGL